MSPQPPLQRVASLVRARPVATFLVLGAIVRLIAAIVGLGFHARDDYFHVLDISLAWIDDPSFVWETSSKAGAGIRSHLLPRIVQGILLACENIGITSPEGQLRVIYSALGAFSLLTIPAAHRFMRNATGETTAIIATGLVALHPVMPYAGTRLLIEALAMPPLLWGLVYLQRKTLRGALYAGVFVGLACWMRYQVGVAAIALAGVVLWESRHDRNALKRFALYALGGAIAVGLQGVYDLATTGRFLGPVLNNIAVNAEPKADLTRSSVFSYLGLWLGMTLPPFTFLLVPGIYLAARRLPLVSIPWLAFLLSHSLIPHKEERFMLPVVPLFLLLMAEALPQIDLWFKDSWWPLWRRRIIGSFLALNGVALVLAITTQTQSNTREAMTHLRNDGEANALVSLGPELQTFFLGRPELPRKRTGKPDLVWLGRQLAGMQKRHDLIPNRYLCFEPDCGALQLMMAALELRCAPPLRFPGHWLDRLVFKANPKHNRRRAPVWLLRCEREAIEIGWAPTSNQTGARQPG